MAKQERIEVGDWVMIVRGHSCLMLLHGGRSFTVAGIHPPTGGGYECKLCRQRSLNSTENSARWEIGGGIAGYVPLSCLIKINPPPLRESADSDTELEVTV